MEELGYWVGAYVTREQIADVIFELGRVDLNEHTRWWQVREEGWRVFVPTDARSWVFSYLSSVGKFGLEFWVALKANPRIQEMLPVDVDQEAKITRTAWYVPGKDNELLVSWGLYQHLRRACGLPAMR